MEANELKQLSVKLMGSANGMYLSTIDEQGYPQTRFIFNLRNREDFPSLVKVFEEHDHDLLIYMGTNTSSEKLNQIKANPNVCVYFCKPDEFHSLMLAGKIEIVEDMEIKKSIWQKGWEMYYPNGPEDTDYTILKLLPIKAKGWYKDDSYNFSLTS